ncbi:MAG: carboxypeptidase, partial [Planctomycetota bacterium]
MLSPSRALPLFLLAAAAPAQEAVLPPELPWDGKSRALAVPAGDPWATPCEASAFRRTPRYGETVAWLERVAAASPEVRMVPLGKSHEGREVWLVV